MVRASKRHRRVGKISGHDDAFGRVQRTDQTRTTPFPSMTLQPTRTCKEILRRTQRYLDGVSVTLVILRQGCAGPKPNWPKKFGSEAEE